MFQYPIPANTLERWKSRVIVDSHSPISLAIATASAILHNLDAATTHTQPTHGNHYLGGRESVLSLAAETKTILGDATNLATSMFPQKHTTVDKSQMLPHHL
jgi:hypothetical protein